MVFSAVRLIPGDVCHIVLQTPDVQQSQCDAINKELGIDQPVVTQYFKYMGGVLKGDFGRSLITKRDVFGEMKDRIPLTIELTLLSTFFALAPPAMMTARTCGIVLYPLEKSFQSG